MLYISMLSSKGYATMSNLRNLRAALSILINCHVLCRNLFNSNVTKLYKRPRRPIDFKGLGP